MERPHAQEPQPNATNNPNEGAPPSAHTPEDSTTWERVKRGIQAAVAAMGIVATPPTSAQERALPDTAAPSQERPADLEEADTTVLVSLESVAQWARRAQKEGREPHEALGSDWLDEQGNLAERVARAWERYVERFSAFPTPRQLSAYLQAVSEGKEDSFDPRAVGAAGAAAVAAEAAASPLAGVGRTPLEQFYEECAAGVGSIETAQERVPDEVRRKAYEILRDWLFETSEESILAALGQKGLAAGTLLTGEEDVKFIAQQLKELIRQWHANLAKEETLKEEELNAVDRVVFDTWFALQSRYQQEAPREGVIIYSLGGEIGGETRTYSMTPSVKDLLKLLRQRVRAHFDR